MEPRGVKHSEKRSQPHARESQDESASGACGQPSQHDAEAWLSIEDDDLRVGRRNARASCARDEGSAYAPPSHASAVNLPPSASVLEQRLIGNISY